MKVILLKDVKNIGKKGDIVDVADGYASNFLLPRKLAVVSSSVNVNKLEETKTAEKEKQKELKKEAQKLAQDLKEKVVETQLNAGKDGKVFGSISMKQVAEELVKQHNIDIDRRKIKQTTPISALGYTDIEIELYKGVLGKIRVHVSEKE